VENIKEIRKLDKQISSGASAIISLVIENRLFVANVGNSHCFICLFNKETLEKSLLILEKDHSLKSWNEIKRLSDLNVDIDALLDSSRNDYVINTRFIGGFELKNYYQELHSGAFRYFINKTIVKYYHLNIKSIHKLKRLQKVSIQL
jgi:TAK1-binding protein 1